jgi:hypothetical protein
MLQWSLHDTIPVRVFWKDLALDYLGCNRPFALDAGLQSPEEITGRSDFEMGWAELAELYRSDDRLVMETGTPKLGYEEPQTTPDGSRIWLRTHKVPLLDTEGNIKGVLGSYYISINLPYTNRLIHDKFPGFQGFSSRADSIQVPEEGVKTCRESTRKPLPFNCPSP